MTRFQVSHNEQPQVNFDQLHLVPTCQKHKGKEPIFDQSPKGETKIEFTPPIILSRFNMPRPSSLFEQDMLFTGNKDKSMDDMMNDRLLRKHGVKPLGPYRTHEYIFGTTLENDFDRDLHGRNQHSSIFHTPPRLSPESFKPMDDKIRQDELEKISYL